LFEMNGTMLRFTFGIRNYGSVPGLSCFPLNPLIGRIEKTLTHGSLW